VQPEQLKDFFGPDGDRAGTGRVFFSLAPEKEMQLYGRGIRRRLAPMINSDIALTVAFTYT